MSQLPALPDWIDRFDPEDAEVVRTPPGEGYGFWVGGHKVDHDPDSGTFSLFYRERTPLEQGRGGRCGVALSGDGVHFDEVWSASREEMNSSSIEVGHALRHSEDEWRLYVSYEIAGTSTWRIDMIRAPEPAAFRAQERRTVLAPNDFGLPWVKDPFLRREDGRYLMYANAPARHGVSVDGRRVHAAPGDATVLAESDDGVYFPAIEYVFEAPGDDTWHGRRARLNCVLPVEGGYVGFYDGGRTRYDDYEELSGLSLSSDGRSFTRVRTEAPWTTSPHGCVRYLYVVEAAGKVYVYYEYTREDHSHELRVSVLDV